jgi:hypothetical protein
VIAALTLLPAIAVVVVWFVLRFRAAESVFDVLTSDERSHEQAMAPTPIEPNVTLVPDGFTCLRCGENPALPAPSIWCAVCAPIVDSFPAEPIERGAL